jgi:hypothetical protein
MSTKRSWSWFILWLTLKTYGANLLCNDAGLWIFSVRLLMLFLISTECASWGYAACQIASPDIAPFVSAFAVLAAFTLNWTLDGSIMTIDREKLYLKVRPAARNAGSLSAQNKILILVLGRMAMISAVLYASSSFLVQAMFHKDIESEMANENRTHIEQKRLDLLKPLEERSTALQKTIAGEEGDVALEIKGLSSTQIPGCGKVCRELREPLANQRLELTATQDRIAAIQKDFEQNTPAELQQRYHIGLLGDGLEARGRIVEKLKQNEGFKRTEWWIQGALTILFMGLLLLKIYQPPSVALYYSAVRQDLFKRYRAGEFNHLLRPLQYPDSPTGGMTPYEFAEWAEDFLAGKLGEGLRKELAILKNDQESSQLDLATRVQKSDKELTQFEARVRDLADRRTALELEKCRAVSAVENLDESIEAAQAEKAKLVNGLTSRELPVEAYGAVVVRIRNIEEAIRRDSEAKERVETIVEQRTASIARIQFEQGALADEAAAKRTASKQLHDEAAELERNHFEQRKEFWKKQHVLVHGGNKTAQPQAKAGRRRA